MAELKFTKGTDEEHEIELESELVYAGWRQGAAIAGETAQLEVETSFVGNGASVKIKCMSESGRKLGSISGVVKNNKYVDEIEIPEDVELGDMVYFQVNLPDNGLSGESNWIEVIPPVEVTEMKWSVAEARRGDIVGLSAKVKNVTDGTGVKLIIYEYDRDGAHDRITELPGTIRGAKIEVNWEYEYHEDTDEIPTEEELQEYGQSYNPPEYFFTLSINDTVHGKQQESGLLKFKDFIEVKLANCTGTERYIIRLPDGTELRGSFGEDGLIREDDIPPGPCTIEIQRDE